MSELENEALAGDRGITPVGGGDNGRAAMLKRAFGALALTAFAFLIIWGTWKSDKPVSGSARKLMIRQAAAFEPVQEPPAAPITTAEIAIGKPRGAHALDWAVEGKPDARRRWPQLPLLTQLGHSRGRCTAGPAAYDVALGELKE